MMMLKFFYDAPVKNGGLKIKYLDLNVEKWLPKLSNQTKFCLFGIIALKKVLSNRFANNETPSNLTQLLLLG